MIRFKNTVIISVLISIFLFFICLGVNYFYGLKNVYIIDRFEGDFAVLERKDRSTFNVPKHQLPDESKEGDVITDERQIDTLSTETLFVQIGELFKKLYSKSSF